MPLKIPTAAPTDATGALTKPWIDFLNAVTRQAEIGVEGALLALLATSPPFDLSRFNNDAGFITLPINLFTLNGLLPTILFDQGVSARARIQQATTAPRLDMDANLSFDGTNWNLDDVTQYGAGIGVVASATTAQVVFRAAPPHANPATVTVLMTFDLALGTMIVSGSFSAVNLNATVGYQANGVAGINATVALAKLTSGGTAGSATYHMGLLTGYVAPS